MHLPFVQIDTEVIEQLAPEVAVELGHDEDAIIGKLSRLIKWAVRRCPDHVPPSSSDIVKGPNAAKHVARAAMWLGDPEEFVNAICRSGWSILERVEGGVRIRGLKRYDRAWKKANPEAWEIFNKLGAGEVSETGAEWDTKPALNGAGKVPVSDTKPAPHKQIQKQTQKQKQIEAEEVSTQPAVALTYEAPKKPEAEWDARDFFTWAQSRRIASGLLGEKWPRPEKLRDFWRLAQEQRVSVRRLQEAFYRYGADPWWERPEVKPAHPWSGFQSQWEKYVPQEQAA